MSYHPVMLIIPPGPIGARPNQTIDWPTDVRLPAVGDMIHYTGEERELLATGTVTQVVFWMARGKAVSGDDLDRLVEAHVHLE